MSSAYWRQPEYEPKAEVANPTAEEIPSSRIWAMVSASIGDQFRLPQYTGRSTPRAPSSAAKAATKSRLHWLMGLTPPNRW